MDTSFAETLPDAMPIIDMAGLDDPEAAAAAATVSIVLALLAAVIIERTVGLRGL